MACPARQVEVEHEMQVHTVLDEKVDHLQRDVSEVKSDVKRLDASLVDHRIQTAASIAKLSDETKESFAAVRGEIDSVVKSTGASEVIVTTMIHDPEERQRSYELLAAS